MKDADIKPTDISRHSLGKLSEKYESGGKGAGTVSHGRGDRGGVSYGVYQFASKTGSADAYVKNSKYASEFKGMKAGTKEFSAKWKEIAARDPEGFRADQHEAIKKSHYDPFVKGVQGKTGLDINQRSKALQDVAWSTSVQHGPGASHIFAAAMKGKDPASMSDADIIRAVYAERGRKKADGNLAHFSKNSKDVQKGVADRFVNERKNALAMLAGEQ